MLLIDQLNGKSRSLVQSFKKSIEDGISGREISGQHLIVQLRFVVLELLDVRLQKVNLQSVKVVDIIVEGSNRSRIVQRLIRKMIRLH